MQISEGLEGFIREEIGLPRKKILFATSLLAEDLGPTGDEASDFMVKFFNNFKVGGSDFDFHRYFLMEGEGLLYALIRAVVPRKRHKLGRRSITLAMLDKAMEDKIWNTARLEAFTPGAE